MPQLIAGIAMVVIGSYIALQWRLPRERRGVRVPNGGATLGARQCIRVGGIVLTFGCFMALDGARVIHTSELHILLAVILSAVAIVAAEFVADS